MTLEMAKGEARPAPPYALPDDQSPRNDVNTGNDTRLRLPVETLAPDHARRNGVAMIAWRCTDCGGYSHLFRAREFAASYERALPCTGRQVVLVAASFHLREVVA